MNNDFQRVAIVNRGEAAMRLIHAVREFNLEQGATLRTIAFFTEPDRHALFVREADEAVSLGSTYFLDPGTQQSKNGYLHYGRLEQALTTARADAAWVGWGLVSKQAEFAELCREMGIVFIGPRADVMRQLGDKITAKRLAEQAGIPVVPWSEGPVETLVDAQHHAKRIGYPLMVKATAGERGRGIRRVHARCELPDVFESVRAEAFEAFGNPTVFIEQLLEGARHLEVDIIADHYGTTWAAGIRDCTFRHLNHKVLVEEPAPMLSSEYDAMLREMAVRLCRTTAYSNAGTVKFLYQPEQQRFLFLGMSTELSAEHPVSECATGLDLVKLQLYLARGGRLEGEPPHVTNHAVAVCLHAEDPDKGFALATGKIERFRIPAGPGVRIDAGVVEGDLVPPEFDTTVAKMIASGRDRKEAFSRLQRALRDSVLVIQDGSSNKAFLLELLNRPEVQSGIADSEWLDRLIASWNHLCRRHSDVALLAAAIEGYDADLALEKTQFYASAARLRPSARSEVGRAVELRYLGHSYSIKTYCVGLRHYLVEAGGSRIDARVDRMDEFEYWMTASGQRFHIASKVQGLNYRIDVNGVSHRIDRNDGGMVHAPAPAVMVSIAVKPGDTVAVGDRLAVLEAMKMEMPVVATFAGKVRQVMTIPNVQVDTGTPLMQIEPATREDTAAAERVVFGASFASCEDRTPIRSQCRQNLDELRQLMLGFDVNPAHSARLFAEWSRHCPTDLVEIRQEEDEILSIFVDVCSLFNRQPLGDDRNAGEAPSAEAYLFSYLCILDSRGEGLPRTFVDGLRRALAHYGVRTLERTPELEESLLWIWKSHRRLEEQIMPIQALLEKRLRRVEASGAHVEESFRMLLDRMISQTNGLFPALTDLAREVRYRYFDQPLFERARKQVYAEVEDHLKYLIADPEAADRRERVRELIDCPQPLVSLFTGRFADADPALRRLMLEVLTWRHYRIRTLLDFRWFASEGHCYVTTEYDYEGRRIHVVTTHAEYPTLGQAVQRTFPLIAEVPADHDVMIDFYVGQQSRSSDPEATQQEIHSILNHAGFARSIRRIVVAVASPGHDRGGMHFFTYRLNGNTYEEEKFYRGIHPMMGKRLHLWRLSNFKVERLPSVEDVYLLHAVAHANPKDERLFACAEVRDLTPVRDESGRIVQLPHLERMLMETFASIRNFQSQRRLQERLYWNRILLYVWPPLTLTSDELHGIVQKLASKTEGLGLEQLIVRARIPNPETGVLRDMVVRISNPGGEGLLITYRPATLLQPIKPLSEYEQKVVRMRQRGFIYPYEIIKMLTPSAQDTRAEFPPGDFVEHDLDGGGRLVPVERPYGQNKANIIVGVIRNFTARYPEGMTRVLLLGDPGKDLGALAEPECRRILAALDLATEEGVPVEWFPISAGAKISMESGVENMDWIARVLRRLVEFTQVGCEVNLVINGINVGAQPYWNAEATMLMHTRGILIMTSKAAMVLTGKRALDFSGGISAEDNQGIGGYDRIMGLNGQAQYWARDIDEACNILLQHYEHSYVAPGERFPRRAPTTDPIDRNVQCYPHSNGHENGFAQVGDIFSDETNPGRKKPFDIRKVMTATVDQDHSTLERWAGMRGAETAVVWDAHLGGFPVCLIGIESRLVPRLGFTPADGPEQWTSGTLFPLSSKKVARAINAASNNRPVVLLANLSGFDGSPESMRKLQLEYGAEIGRAVVNFKGPMIFCVISRYHGGAYVVFSQALNENLQVVALEGTYASVIGGAPAAAVVFAGEVDARSRKDPRLQALNDAMSSAQGSEKARLRAQWDELFKVVHSEKLGEVAAEFDRVHSVHRALKVGALRDIIPPANLRPFLIHAIERATSGEAIPETDKMESKSTKEIEAAA